MGGALRARKCIKQLPKNLAVVGSCNISIMK